jgi:hypothetical protein
LQVAEQEINSADGTTTKLIILSDFLEDDESWNFAKNDKLASSANARRLADTMATHETPTLNSPHIYLGRLQSRDSATLSTSRSDAIDTFWGELFRKYIPSRGNSSRWNRLTLGDNNADMFISL